MKIPASQRTSCVWNEVGRSYWVYLHVDADGNVLYVGCTADRRQRASAHRRLSPWFSLVAETQYEGPFHREPGRDRERELIVSYDPPNNVMFTPRWKPYFPVRVA